MVTEISNVFTGTGIPTDEPMIDEVGDRGIVLANGTELTYGDLGRILAELGNRNLLMSSVIRDSISATHAASTFKEAGRLFGTI